VKRNKKHKKRKKNKKKKKFSNTWNSNQKNQGIRILANGNLWGLAQEQGLQVLRKVRLLNSLGKRIIEMHRLPFDYNILIYLPFISFENRVLCIPLQP